MKKIMLFVLLFSFVFFAVSCSFLKSEFDATVDMTPRKISAAEGLSTEQVVESVKPAVVGISAYGNSGTSVGSGVAIENGGYILTNHHVVAGSNQILVHYANKTQGAAEFIWSDSSLDMAIIKSSQNMPYLECGTSKSLRVGQDIIAIGTPLTLQFKHTVTKGIISALNRTLEVGGISDATYLQNLIQHDASINPGNSGGPLITMDCKLVGINTLKAEQSEGIGFAIPIEAGEAISKQVVQNHSYLPVYVGVFGFDATIASFHNQTTENEGVFVVTVDKESPAEKAGIKNGDVVISVGEKKIETVMDFRIALYDFQNGDRIMIKVLRDGKEINFEMKAKNRE